MADIRFDVSKLTDEQLLIADKIVKEAERQGVNPDVVLPMAFIESRFNPKAVSSKKAIGVMQLMPSTAKELGVNPHDEDENIRGGVTYIKQLMESKAVDHDPAKLIAAYHDGPNSAFFKTGDASKISDNAIRYIDQFNSLTGGLIKPKKPEGSAPSDTAWQAAPLATPEPEQPKQYGFSPSAMAPGAAIGAPAGAAFGTAKRGFSMLKSGADTMSDLATAVTRAADTMASPGVATGTGLPAPQGPATRVPAGGTGTFNYAKKFGLTDFDAARAANMSKGPGGTWDVARQVAEAEAKIGPGYRMVPERADLLLPESAGGGPRGARRMPIPPVAGPAPRGALARAGEAVSGFIGRHPIAMGALGGAGAGAMGAEAMERYRTGDPVGAGIAGTGAVGSLMSMLPRTGPLGLATSVAAPAILAIGDYVRNRQASPTTPLKISEGILNDLKQVEQGIRTSIASRKGGDKSAPEGFQIPVMAP